MPEFLTNEFFLFLVGTVGITAIYVPWQGHRFQDRQREIGVRTNLVAKMSQCVMTFDTELKHRARSGWAASKRRPASGDQASPGADSKGSPDATLAFDVMRCVIGTELEAYFSKLTIAADWDRFTGLFIKFSQLPVTGAKADYDSLAAELATFPLGERERLQAEARATMVLDLDPNWARLENVLLAEKLRLIEGVLTTEMPKLKLGRPEVAATERSRVRVAGVRLADGRQARAGVLVADLELCASVSGTWAWGRSRSTVAVASVSGMIVSNPMIWACYWSR